MWKFIRPKPPRVYLDHAAATPLTAAVKRAMEVVEREHFANPSALHKEGVAARQVIKSARAKLARCLKVRPEHITYTGSGTESNNLAIIGTVYACHSTGVAYEDMEIVTTAIEHPSVSEACAFAARLGVKILTVDTDSEGRVQPAAFESVLSEKTVLVSVAYINSEVGVIQPLKKLTRIVRKCEKLHGTNIHVHADAAQAPYWEPCQFDALLVDILSLDAGKCGGPKGVGVVAVRHGVMLAPVLFGGPQERALRPATENTVGIVGASNAIIAAQERRGEVTARIRKLRDKLLHELLQLEDVVVNGSLEHRVANNINVSIPGIDSEFLAISLDEAGVAASTKSACSGASGGGSGVVLAITRDAARATSTLRLTLGPTTTEHDVAFATQQIVATIKKLQAQQKGLTQAS